MIAVGSRGKLCQDLLPGHGIGTGQGCRLIHLRHGDELVGASGIGDETRGATDGGAGLDIGWYGYITTIGIGYGAGRIRT